MEKAKILIVLLGMLLVLLATGCENVDVSKISDKDLGRIADKAIVCEKPYIRHSMGCCLDVNENGICDKDEVNIETNEKTPKTETTTIEVVDSTVEISETPTTQNSEESAETEISDIEEGTTLSNNDGNSGTSLKQVKMIAYIDYEDLFSIKFYEDVYPQIEDEYIKSGKLTFELRNYPLPSHPNAWKAAEAIECAKDQGYFLQMNNIILEKGVNGGISQLEDYAEEIGMNEDRFSICLENGEKYGRVDNSVSIGNDHGITGTPTFFINDKKISGAQPFEFFKKFIDEELTIN